MDFGFRCLNLAHMWDPYQPVDPTSLILVQFRRIKDIRRRRGQATDLVARGRIQFDKVDLVAWCV